MSLRRFACALAVLAVLCVLTVFFFHAIEGPYCVVHGPVTALLSARAAAGLRLTIMLAGLSIVRVWFGWALVLLSGTGIFLIESQPPHSFFEYSSILRC